MLQLLAVSFKLTYDGLFVSYSNIIGIANLYVKVLQSGFPPCSVWNIFATVRVNISKRQQITTRGQWALSLCSWCLTICHLPLALVQLSFMLNGHVAEVKYLVLFFLRCKSIYIHLFRCTIKTTKWPWTLKGHRFPPFLHPPPPLGDGF